MTITRGATTRHELSAELMFLANRNTLGIRYASFDEFWRAFSEYNFVVFPDGTTEDEKVAFCTRLKDQARDELKGLLA